ncbi:uncharacterized protein METZ01_LOCUS296369, partial [marine metagenome]
NNRAIIDIIEIWSTLSPLVNLTELDSDITMKSQSFCSLVRLI